VAEVNVPLAQVWQTRSLVAVAAVLMLVPAAHVVMVEHARSWVLLGALDWYCAAVHWDHAVHAVAFV
jgi:hypothetical protein